MNTLYRPGSARLHKQDSWKKSAYSFVPYQTHFGELCGFAEDVVAAGKGFGMHPHENMEISTIVLQGSQLHRDNTGGEALIGSNVVQTMSAGTGIMHSEFNASQTESFHSYQIWVYPKKINAAPGYRRFAYQPEDKLNKVLLAISPDGRSNSAAMNQDAFFSLLTLTKDNSAAYSFHQPGNGVYVHVAKGSVSISGQQLGSGDALGVYETDQVTIAALEDTELIFVEVPMQRGVRV